MQYPINRKRLLASSMLCGATLVAGQAFAADAAPATVTEIVVTGTRIPTPNLTSVSPVTSIGSADIKAQGVTRVEDLINSLPQAFAAQNSAVSNGSNGTATVNLRGIGPNRTVVLIDGRRLQAGNPTSAISANGIAADLNFIPTSLVERVDVLTGGASAVYGADAVAGVVNFIMKKDFEGVRIDAQYSTFQHSQHNSTVADLVRAKSKVAAVPSQFVVPGDIWDGDGSEVTLTVGVNAPDGKGNITAYATYLNFNPILASNRDFTSCVLNSGATTFTALGTGACGGSGTAYPARFGSFIVDPAGPGNTFRPRTANDVYNFAPTNYLQRPDTRYGLGAFAHYELAPWAEAYMDVMYMDDTSTFQIAPGGIFSLSGPNAGGWNINCDNPLMTFVQQQQLCGANAGTANTVSVNVARRNIEGGGRQGRFDHNEYRYVVGLRGDINKSWSYDGYLQYGSTALTTVTSGFFINSRIANALIAKRQNPADPTSPIVCQSVLNGTDPSCVPYNIYQLNGVTQAALNYLQAPSFSGGTITERVANLNIIGKLGDYGVKSPWAQEGVGVSLGAEYRREHLDFGSDFVSASGQLNGSGGAAPPVNGGFDVYEIYGETRIPIVEDMPWAKSVAVELAYRYSDYSSVGTTNTYKVAGDWAVMNGLRFRLSYNRAVRAPNVVELFSPQNVVLDGTTDPCAGLKPTDPLVAKCASIFHLTTQQVLAIEPDPASQYNGRTGGNPNLAPETADTWTAGVVLQPTFLPGFHASVDWYQIEVEDFISGIGADTILDRCINRNDAASCALVHRDAAGSIRTANGFVIDTTFNTGGIKVSGIDVDVGYRTSLDAFGLENMGSLSANLVGSYLDKDEITPNKGDTPFDCAGKYGSFCGGLPGTSGNPQPKWRHKARLTWTTPFPMDLALSAQWRYFGSVDLDPNSPQQGTDQHFGSRSYLDLLATWTVKDNYSFRLGVNNVLDKDPPLSGQANCPAGPCNQNVWPGVYDGMGRFLFLGVTANF